MMLKASVSLFLKWRQTSIFRVLLTRLRTPASKNKWVYAVHEDLVGRYKTGNTKAEKVTKIIKESVCRIGLDLDECRGQGYDEACNMKGNLSGGQARIKSEDRQTRAKWPRFPQIWQETLRAGHNDRFRWVSRPQKKNDTTLTTEVDYRLVQAAAPELLAVESDVIMGNDWSGTRGAMQLE